MRASVAELSLDGAFLAIFALWIYCLERQPVINKFNSEFADASTEEVRRERRWFKTNQSPPATIRNVWTVLIKFNVTDVTILREEIVEDLKFSSRRHIFDANGSGPGTLPLPGNEDWL